ncbi:uncharacterized protein LOC132276760 isoform X2 [Cornus florida]|uniref:uncharacterized protein LOC132276760 isoform X2 n=1 Tax=Cornus florida TaxID=4283 RepID=UPI00289FF4C7|nr:uncharacterized protein LOC132276760 isoform X2 [Cornus florida]
MHNGKLLGCFLGKCSGSIRAIARHPEHPVIASCGLDNYLRLWGIKSRQLLSAVFLKQHLTNVVFDSNFSNEEVFGGLPPIEAPDVDGILIGREESLPVKRKKASKENSGSKKSKTKKKSKKAKGKSIYMSFIDILHTLFFMDFNSDWSKHVNFA